MNGKFAFAREVTASVLKKICAQISEEVNEIAGVLTTRGLVSLRLYAEEFEGRCYIFQFYAIDGSASDCEAIFAAIRGKTSVLEGWKQARHVYEFRLYPGDCYEGLKTQGIIIGVREGMLDEYIRLHDEQPSIIHDLCYQNGFRKSSIFVADLHRQMLLQFQEFSGEENPELYKDETYQNWLKVTGACQEPLPGEKFWKPMEMIWGL